MNVSNNQHHALLTQIESALWQSAEGASCGIDNRKCSVEHTAAMIVASTEHYKDMLIHFLDDERLRKFPLPSSNEMLNQHRRYNKLRRRSQCTGA